MNRSAIFAAVIAATATASASMGAEPISVRESFRIGNAGAVLCSAQGLNSEAALTGMFDRGYSVVCRDAAVPVGEVYALRSRNGEPAARLAALRANRTDCGPSHRGSVTGIGAVTTIDCRLKDADVAYRVYELRRGNTFYSAEGLVGYDSALQLALRSVVADKPVPGEVSIATTGAGDPSALARVQAGALDSARALAEAYRRNNAGSFAESAEFFASVSQGGEVGRVEGLVNEALQKSNLGRYEEADLLFGRAAEAVGPDPIVLRQLRNYRAMHFLNQGQPDTALGELVKPLPAAAVLEDSSINQLVIDQVTAARLNADSPVSRKLGGGSATLLPKEKAEILDGQALQLRGTAMRLKGDTAAAKAAFAQSNAKLSTVRGGKVSSVVWMRGQILSDLAALAEADGNAAEAEKLFRESVAVIEANYPGSAALLSARGRLAAYLARSGQEATAAAMFKSIVQAQSGTATAPPSLARVLTPYVDLLLKNAADPHATADLFEATQVMLRPGVAQTQAVLARELTGGSDDASRMFRQAVTLTRQIERDRVELARLQAIPQPTAAEAIRANALRASLDEAEKDQVATQARLAAFPRFRAVSGATISLPELQKTLRRGEAYYKMTVVGDRVYALVATPSSARAVRIQASAQQLENEVDALRETISTVENGQRITYAFDVDLARRLYVELLQPFEGDLAGVHHVIFEPDGAMLRLPPNLLIASDQGLDTYRKRAAAGGDAEFDFTGLQWFGRERDISTSVSARAFRDVRLARPAAARKAYLGLGENSPATAFTASAVGTRSVEDLDCSLALSSWNQPISPAELRTAGTILSGGNPANAEILTRDAFTDSALKARQDLKDFRIIHFATHGIVTAPRQKCAAQPALMTSFGGEGSDGLLTFREIFDLRLDADLVILSACDTASKASTAATREAGLATGGDVALDGLVRAFVGAGGRLIIASHWPVPDDFNATQRLITGLFTAPAGTSTASALRQSQRSLMDDPATSHPFYWSGFAAIGDGAAPVVRKPQALAQVD